VWYPITQRVFTDSRQEAEGFQLKSRGLKLPVGVVGYLDLSIKHRKGLRERLESVKKLFFIGHDFVPCIRISGNE
jgi:hypothetical protein